LGSVRALPEDAARLSQPPVIEVKRSLARLNALPETVEFSALT